MYASTSLRQVYSKFRAKDKNYIYAIAQGDFFVFVLGDAYKVHELLSDMVVEKCLAGYATVQVHSASIFQLIYRLNCLGQKVAMVARRVNANKKVSYYISERFGDDTTDSSKQ